MFWNYNLLIINEINAICNIASAANNVFSTSRNNLLLKFSHLLIEMATTTQIYEGEHKFDLRVRFQQEYRKSDSEIGDLLIPTMNSSQIPLKELAKIYYNTGPILVFREANKRFNAVKFSVCGHDMGSAIAEAQQKVNAHVKLPNGYSMKWTGDFENQQRATSRLMQVVSVSLLLIFLILFVLLGNIKDAGIILVNVPFAKSLAVLYPCFFQVQTSVFRRI